MADPEKPATAGVPESLNDLAEQIRSLEFELQHETDVSDVHQDLVEISLQYMCLSLHLLVSTVVDGDLLDRIRYRELFSKLVVYMDQMRKRKEELQSKEVPGSSDAAGTKAIPDLGSR